MTSQNTRYLVDPGLLSLLDTLPRYELTQEILPSIRENFGRMAHLIEDPNALAGVETTVQSIAGSEGQPDVRVIVHRPRNRSGASGAILHIHGGGYVIGDAATLAPIHRKLAMALGCVIVSVDYRLAPETKAPGAVEDCYAALIWLMSEVEELGVDARRVGVLGESAGGGLAAALALLARDRGNRCLAFQHLIYPMLDDRTSTNPDQNPYAGEFVWTREQNHFGWKCLLGTEPGGSEISPYAAPARAGDLAGLPPTYIAVGTLDLFIDEDLAYAKRLIRAAVPTELHVYPGAFHGFHFDVSADVTVKANADSRAALKRALSHNSHQADSSSISLR